MLLQILQEAATLSIPEVKKALKKDPRTVIMLAKTPPKLEDISDMSGFFSTIKYLALNNTNVLKFVKSRDSVKDMSSSWLKDVRSLRADKITQSDLDDIHQLLTLLFKEHTSVQNDTMSKDLRRELSDWVNTSARYYNLPLWATNELKSLPDIRPKKQVILYRGILFSDYDLQDRKSYDGTLDEGNGIKFLRSIRKGQKIVDLEWDRPSSWTKDKKVAEQFAKNGPASSSFSATMQWLQNSGKAIQGAMGFIIAVVAKPDDVLIDLTRVRIRSGYAEESEMILRPGTYTAKIIKKFTVDGEVDLEKETEQDNTKIDEIFDYAAKAVEGLKSLDNFDFTGVTSRIILGGGSMAGIKTLVNNTTTSQIMSDVQKMIDLSAYIEKNTSKESLAAGNFADDKERRLMAKALRDIQRRVNEWASDAKSDASTLSAEAYSKLIRTPSANLLDERLLFNRSIASSDLYQMRYVLTPLQELSGISLPPNMNKLGGGKQREAMASVMNKMADELGVKKENDLDTMKNMINIVRRMERNNKLLHQLDNIRDLE